MNANTKSVILFLLIYLGSISIFASITAYMYYQEEKSSIIEQMRQEMRYKARSINARLEFYHTSQGESFTFYDEGYDIALYDIERQLLASTFDEPIDFSRIFYANDNNEYYLVESILKEYLGVKYIVIKTRMDQEKLDQITHHILLTGLYGFAFMIFVALLLSKVMLYPIKNTMKLLKKFIKDTTHEMNTPISTILMSNEHFDRSTLNEKQLRSLNRIEIATKTLSNLYNDLSYASFNEHIEYEDTPINIKEVIEERIRYFDTLIEFKKIQITTHLEDRMIRMDKRKLILIIDNLLSNAIKFTKKQGRIEITLTKKYLSVRDNGIGISKEDQKVIFNRFKSANTFNGGFGVGLDIVSQICKEYDIKIILDSELNQGSEFKLLFNG